MTAAEFSTRILAPAAAAFPFKDSPQARALLLAIAGVESAWTARFQDGGPARGFWQFERGGVSGVLDHPASGDTLKAFCATMEIPPLLDTIYEAIAWHDPLAYACARLLLWTDPEPLPQIGDMETSRITYERLWNPGKPSASRWTTRFAWAMSVIGPAVA